MQGARHPGGVGAPLTAGGLVLGALEAPAGHDEHLGQLFRQMRQASGLTPVMIVARLSIEPATLQALEAGAILALPDWNETVRIVTAYARMVNLDPGVALNRIAAQRKAAAPAQVHVAYPGGHQGAHAAPHPQSRPGLQPPAARGQQATGGTTRGWIQLPPPRMAHGQHASHQQAPNLQGHAFQPPSPIPAANQQANLPTLHQATPASGLSPVNPLQPPPRPARPESEAAQNRMAVQIEPMPDTGTDGGDGIETRQRRHPARTALRYVTAPMIVIAGLWYTVQHPTTVHAALGQLPEPLTGIARAGMDLVLVSTAPTKDGLRMIPTGDPRSRKTDKLPVRQAGGK
jgi:Helix-turn-helix domain